MNEYKLGEICKIYNGATPSTTDNDNYDGDIVWATPKDLSDQKAKYFYKGERNITQKGYDSCSTQMIPANNILMSSRAPIGLLAINKVDCCTNQGFKNIVIDKNYLDIDYLYYYLKVHINEIENLSGGTTFKEISKSSLENLTVNIDNLENQKKIGTILNILDHKIILNNQIISKLESISRLLYDYWFVQFDFPNKDGKPYKSNGGKMVYNEKLKRDIPEGWKFNDIKKYCNVIDCLHSKKPNFKFENENYYLLSLENLTKDGNIDTSHKYYISENDYKLWTSRIEIKENDFLFTNAGRAGDIGKVPKGIQCAIGRNITAVRPFNINPYYLRCFFYSNYMKEQILNSLDVGSFFYSFNVRSIKKLNVLFPSDLIYQKFNLIITPIIKTIEDNYLANQKLIQLRDKILPPLMNGQVTI